MSANPNNVKRTVTTATFAAEVVETSSTTPVLADFWADWCGPCKQLTPVLERLADEYGGRFILAKINADEEGELAGQVGVRSLPTVILFKDKAVADHFIGMVPETQIRQMLDRHLPQAVVKPIDRARELKTRGDYAGAHAILAQALMDSPTDIALLAELVELQIRQGQLAEARTAYSELKGREPAHHAVKRLNALLVFSDVIVSHPDASAVAAQLHANPNDPEAIHASAVHHLLSGDNEGALKAWLQMMRTHRTYQDDLARKSLVLAFEVIGENDPLVPQIRREMARLLF